MKTIKVKNFIFTFICYGIGYITLIADKLIKLIKLNYNLWFSISVDIVDDLRVIPGLFLFFLASIILGMIDKIRWWIVGVSMAMPLPLMSIYDIIQNGSSHNLWPFEYMIYIAIMFISTVGSYIGYRVKLLKERRV